MAIGTPEVPSHNLTVLSRDAEASRDPSGENDKGQESARVAIGTPDAPSHNRAVLSSDTEASRDPSGRIKVSNPREWQLVLPKYHPTVSLCRHPIPKQVETRRARMIKS